MNKYTGLFFLFLLVQCDDESDDRDTWVGKWYGTITSESMNTVEVKKDQTIEFQRQKGDNELLCTGALNFSLILQSHVSGNFHYVEPASSRGDYWVKCEIRRDSLVVKYDRFPVTIYGRFGRK
ncbi:MAG TPA: hypothetical protein VIU13_08675 [Chryseolinea sp.]